MSIIKLGISIIVLMVVIVEKYITGGINIFSVTLFCIILLHLDPLDKLIRLIGVFTLFTIPFAIVLVYARYGEATLHQWKMIMLLLIGSVLLIGWSKTYGKQFEKWIDNKIITHPVLDLIHRILIIIVR